MSEQAVIVGYGAITGLGRTAQGTFDALCEGRSALGPVQTFDASAFICSAASQIADLDADSLGIAPRDARTMGFHSFGLIAAARAAHHAARLDQADVARERIAFFTGMGMVDYRVEDLMPAILRSRTEDGGLDLRRFCTRAYNQIHPLWPLCTLNNMGLAQAAIDLDVRGDNTTFSPYGEAGAQAVREAERSVCEGSADVALAAGVAEMLSPQSFARHQNIGHLSPSSRLMPFAASRDGSLLGEAAAAIAFEQKRNAEARGREALARVAGYAMRYGRSTSESSLTEAVAGAMRQALAVGGIAPDEVGAVFANGDGCPLRDAAEARAISEVLGANAIVTATKAALGNTLAASGPLDIVMGVLAIERAVVPPCCASQADPDLGLALVVDKPARLARPWVMVNTQGLSGQCASILLGPAKE